MSAAHPELPSFGSTDLYRHEIGERLASAEIYCRLGQGYLDVADDAGLDHACRCLAAHVRMSLSLLGDLKALKAEQAARRAAAVPLVPEPAEMRR